VFQTPEHKTDLGQKNMQSKAVRGGYDMHIAQLNSLKQAFFIPGFTGIECGNQFSEILSCRKIFIILCQFPRVFFFLQKMMKNP